jgi:hypothetical protein
MGYIDTYIQENKPDLHVIIATLMYGQRWRVMGG